MTITAWPKARVGTTENQWSELWDSLVGTGATGDASFAPSADGSGLNVKIAPGFGFVRSVAWKSSAVETVSIGAAPTAAGVSRIDTVVARLKRDETPVIKLAVVAGEPSTAPVAPALTQAEAGVWEWPIADVLVGTNVTSIAANRVTDRRSRSGSAVGAWTNGLRPPGRAGLFGFNLTTGKWEGHNGTDWGTITPSLSEIEGTLPVAKGGTGATTAANARTALGAAAAAHTHSADDITSGTLSLARGGTGATSAAAARTALGAAAASHSHAWGDITGKPSTFPSTWATVSGKPSSFTPASHTHSWGQITGKPSIPSDQGSNVQTLQAGGFSRLVWDRNITSSRRAAWIADGSNILLGHTDSSERFKDNITTDTGIDPLAVLEIDVVLYQWIVELRKRDDPTFEGYVGPHHKVAVEVGMIAERLHEAGLWQFVYYEHEDDGSLRLVDGEPIPQGIHYELWAMAVLVATKHVWAEHQALAARTAALESRLANLEGAS